MDHTSCGCQGLLLVAQLQVPEDLQGELEVSQGKYITYQKYILYITYIYITKYITYLGQIYYLEVHFTVRL